MYVTVAEQEALFNSVTRFSNELKAHGFAYEFHFEAGGHNWNEWNKEIPGCMKELTARVK